MRFRDLVTGAEADESIEDTSYGAAWANDNATVFYVRVDEAMRPFQLWRHRVGTDPATDVLVIEEPDDHFYLGVGRTKDDCYVLCALDSKITSEVRILRRRRPRGRVPDRRAPAPGRRVLRRSRPRGPGHGRPGRFLVVTNDGAEDFRLMEAPDGDPGREHWTEVIPARNGVRLDAVDPFVRHLAVYERSEGEHPDAGGRTRHRRTRPRWHSPSRRPPCGGRPNPEYDSTVLRYEYTSLVTPRSVYDLDLDTGELTCASASRCSASSTPPATGPSGCGPRPTTGPGCRSRWCGGRTWWTPR